MYTEWRDPYFFPEVVYSEARTEWVENMPFNKCFVHAERGGEVEKVEEVTIPVLSLLDDKWCEYSEEFIRRMAGGERAVVPLPLHPRRALRQLPARAVPRHRHRRSTRTRTRSSSSTTSSAGWSRALEETGQLEDTMIFLSSDNGPQMETWPDAAYTPFRCAKGSTWEGGVRVPGIVVWPGMIEPTGPATGCSASPTCCRRCSRLAGEDERVPDDRFIDGVDQTSFLLAPDGRVEPQVPLLLAAAHVLGGARSASTSS